MNNEHLSNHYFHCNIMRDWFPIPTTKKDTLPKHVFSFSLYKLFTFPHLLRRSSNLIRDLSGVDA